MAKMSWLVILGSILVVVIVVTVVLLAVLVGLVPVRIDAVLSLTELEVADIVFAEAIAVVDDRFSFVDLSGLDIIDILLIVMSVVAAAMFVSCIVMGLVDAAIFGVMVLMALSSSLAGTVMVVSMVTMLSMSVSMLVAVLVSMGSLPLAVVSSGMVVCRVDAALVGVGLVSLLEVAVSVGLLEHIFCSKVFILMSVYFLVFHISVIGVAIVAVPVNMSLMRPVFVGSRSAMGSPGIVCLGVLSLVGLIVTMNSMSTISTMSTMVTICRVSMVTVVVMVTGLVVV